MKRLIEMDTIDEYIMGSRKYARSANGPVVARNGVSERKEYENITCYECDAPLHYRVNHLRTRNGIEYNVNACFSHISHDADCRGTGESYYHKAAKDAVLQTTDLKFTQQCLLCRKDFHIDVKQNAIRTILEWKWEDFVLDVAFIGPDNKLVGVVEIYYTHEISAEKRKALSIKGVAWVEVAALNVLSAVESGSRNVSVMDCAMTKLRCWECEQKCDQEELIIHNNKRHIDKKTRKLDFGKYKGLSMNDVWVHDPRYIKSISGYTGYREGNKPVIQDRASCISIEVMMEARKLMIGHCILCLSTLASNEPTWKRWCKSCYINSD